MRDAGLIAAAQKVEHYEMSGYGSAPCSKILFPPFVSMPVTWEELEKARGSKKSQSLYFDPAQAHLCHAVACGCPSQDTGAPTFASGQEPHPTPVP